MRVAAELPRAATNGRDSDPAVRFPRAGSRFVSSHAIIYCFNR